MSHIWDPLFCDKGPTINNLEGGLWAKLGEKIMAYPKIMNKVLLKKKFKIKFSFRVPPYIINCFMVRP